MHDQLLDQMPVAKWHNYVGASLPSRAGNPSI